MRQLDILTARIRPKGQLTIPLRARRHAGLQEGSIVELEMVDGGILLRPRPLADEEMSVDAEFAKKMIAETVAGYAALREDPGAWRIELRERAELEGPLGDRLNE